MTGNHDSPDWLGSLHTPGHPLVPIDPSEVFSHAANGSTIDLGGRRIGFLGGIEEPAAGHDIKLEAGLGPDGVGVLITHDGPYGLASWLGRTQGSRKPLKLLERKQPVLHLHGHYHHPNGPRRYGRTTSFGLGQLVPPHGRPNRADIADGSLGLLDTESLTFEYLPPGDVPRYTIS